MDLAKDEKEIGLNPALPPAPASSSSGSKPEGEMAGNCQDLEGQGQGQLDLELGSERGAVVMLVHPTLEGSKKEGEEENATEEGAGAGSQPGGLIECRQGSLDAGNSGNSPYLIFPDLVWTKILEKLEDSKDIQNLLKVYPELEGDYVLENKFSWLMDQVVPHIRPWLTFPQLLSCRGVSQRWCHGVDNYLENHPTRRAYDPERVITGQLWLPGASVAAYSHSQSRDLPWLSFQEGMWNSPLEKNPLVGRSLELSYDGSSTRGLRGVDLNWKKAVEFLQCFGKHVWFLEVIFAHIDSIHLCQVLVEALQLVPNLKSLSFQTESIIYFEGSDVEIEALLGSRGGSLPALPHLETLKYPIQWEALPQELSNALLGRYSFQIRRLHIHSANWRREQHSNRVPLLTELMFPSWERPCELRMVDDVLKSLKTSKKLSDLDLLVRYDRCGRGDLGGGDILSWLKPFPMMEALHLTLKLESNWGLAVKPNRAATVRIPSLKSLWIEQEKCDWVKSNLDFLTCFPSLEYLKITFNMNAKYADVVWVVDEGTEGRIMDMFNELPKLKEVAIKYFREGRPGTLRSRHVSRARYELVKSEEA